MFIAWLNFLAMLLVTGILLRYIELMWPNTALGRALTVVY